jgi:hypothetical protein
VEFVIRPESSAANRKYDAVNLEEAIGMTRRDAIVVIIYDPEISFEYSKIYIAIDFLQRKSLEVSMVLFVEG